MCMQSAAAVASCTYLLLRQQGRSKLQGHRTRSRARSTPSCFQNEIGVNQTIDKYGGPGRSRTADQQFRKLLLYPSELRGRWAKPIPVSHGYFTEAGIGNGLNKAPL